MTGPEDLVITRTLPVPRDRVFAAWLDPKLLALFMRPGVMPESTVEVDTRVGGKFRILMNHGASDDGVHWGEYLLIDPPSKLSFTWISAYTDRQETVVTIEFREKGTGTELVLTHSGLSQGRNEAHRQGWAGIMGALGKTMAG